MPPKKRKMVSKKRQVLPKKVIPETESKEVVETDKKRKMVSKKCQVLPKKVIPETESKQVVETDKKRQVIPETESKQVVETDKKRKMVSKKRQVLPRKSQVLPKKVIPETESKQVSETYFGIHYDPIGTHLITLRNFIPDLKAYERMLKRKKSACQIPVPTIPGFPPNYPTIEYLQKVQKKECTGTPHIVFNGHISINEVDIARTTAIKNILSQIGYDVEDMEYNDAALAQLSQIADTFLRSFFDPMTHRDSEVLCKNENVFTPDLLETKLRKFGLGGVSGVKKYFYDEFVRMHDAVYKDCVAHRKKIKKLFKAMH